MEWDDVWMARALPHDSLVIEPLYDTSRSGNPEKKTQMPHLVFLWVAFGINSHPFNANLRTVESPHVYIYQGSRGGRNVVHDRRSTREYMRRWQDLADTTDPLKSEQTVAGSMTGGVEGIEGLQH